jgi:Kef-type K+ transport system membrane component KefB/predicted transcriptional regulator
MSEHLSHDVMLMLGVGVFGGLVGGWLFQKIRVPQVVGYIGIGLLIGESGLQLVRASDTVLLEPFTLFALAVIGFLVGGELKVEDFRKHGRQFAAILLGEGLMAFILVAAGSGLLLWLVSHSWKAGVAGGVVLGAVASATDPASTINVLWEYRTAGPLTTTLTAIVALDDALAMILYALGTSAARMLTLGGGFSLSSLLPTLGELGLAGVMGCGFALALIGVLQVVREGHIAAAAAAGACLLVVAGADLTGTDVILVSMVCGFVLRNASRDKCESTFALMRQFSLPIMVVFFVLVGARLEVSALPLWLVGVVVLYVVARNGGKMLGAYLGGRISRSLTAVRKYTGLGLFTQGGVAVGLSIMATHRLGDVPATHELQLGQVIIFTITTTTLIVEVIGPPMVKLASKLAGEVGKNVTEDDVIDSWTVADVTDREAVSVSEGDRLRRVFQLFSTHDYLAVPVVGDAGELIGIVSMDVLKSVLADHDMWEWLLVSDVMEPAEHRVSPSMPLAQALRLMQQMALEQVPVVDEVQQNRPLGLLSLSRVRRLVRQEALRRQQPAAAVAGAGH